MLIFPIYLFVLAFTSSIAHAQSVLQLDGPKSAEELQPHISFYLDEDWEKNLEDMLGTDANLFSPIQTTDPDFGYTNARVWLQIRVENTSEEINDWRLHFRENFKQEFDVFVARDNFAVENVLSQDLKRGFGSRTVQFPELVAPIQLVPGEQATIIVRFWSEGASYMRLGFESATSFADVAAKRFAKNFIYYGMMILLLIAGLVGWFIYGHPVFPSYIIYAGSTLLFLMHSDGVAYQYLWPNSPAFNSDASMYVGTALIVSACFYARVFLHTKKHHPKTNLLLMAVILVTLATFLSSFFIDKQIVKKYLVLLSLCAVIACITSGIVASFTRFKEVRFFLFAWVGVVIASAIMNLRHWIGLDISQDAQYDIIRLATVADAFLLGFGIADRYNQLRAARHRAMSESLQAAERNLHLSRRLGDLEEKYEFVNQLAASKDQALINTIHDLRKPLHALRLNVHEMMERGSEEGGSKEVESTFSYLERLVGSHLQASVADHPEPASREHSMGEQSGLSLHQVLASIRDMFQSDAASKGLELIYMPTTLDTPTDPLVVMRIVSNLVSNAIDYTDNGRVLLGCRRAADRVVVQVHDTGAGLTNEEFKVVCERASRLEPNDKNTEGYGYGLSIVQELCDENGLEFSRISNRSGGVGLQISFPRRGLAE